MMRKCVSFIILLTFITLLTGFGLVCAGVNADDSTVSTVTVSIDVACSLSATEDTPHSSPIPDGIYTPNIGTTTIKTVCNDNEGFAIYAAGYTGDEVGGTNSNKLVGTSVSNNAVIDSGIATTSGSSDVSNWAMKLAITQDSGDTTSTNAFMIDSAPNVDLPSQAEQGATQASFSNYHTVPNEYVKVAHKNSVTDMNTTTGGVKLTTTYAAYISKTQPADTYSGQVIYTLVHPSNANAPFVPSPINCEPGMICYNSNAGDVVGTMGRQNLRNKDWSSCTYTDNETYCFDNNSNEIDINTLPHLDNSFVEETTLYASNFKREGYGFAGWNDSYDMTGTNYGPNQGVEVSQDMKDSGLSLYAHWVESSGSLQGWTGCSSLGLNQVIGLTDIRDGNVYAVAKLADGNCWMIENFRLSDSAIAFDSASTNNPASGFTSLPADSSQFCYADIEFCVDQILVDTDNTTLFTSNTTSNQHGLLYSYGNYYTWNAATAGTGTHSVISSNATGSICPNGWTLPSGWLNNNNKGQFSALDIAIGGTGGNQYTSEASNRWRSYPVNILYSEDTGGSSRGKEAYYWTSTAGSSFTDVSYFSIDTDGVYHTFIGFRGDGVTVRCLTSGT